jgi:hypothetical protein
MMVSPTPTIVTTPVDESTVATAAFVLENANVPVLVDVGAVTVNGSAPYSWSATMRFPKVGVPLSTVKVVECVPAR